MKILSLSDFHGKEEIWTDFFDAVKNSNFDLVIFTGDILKWRIKCTEWAEAKKEKRMPDKNKPKIKEEIEENTNNYWKFYLQIAKLNRPTVLIPGNVDSPISQYLKVATEAMKNPNIHIVHHSFFVFNDSVIAGFGGEITEEDKEDFFVLQYPRWEADYGLKFLSNFNQQKILLFHTPPVGKLDSDNGKHKGSAVINDIIQKYKPSLAFCGHAHKAQGEEKIEQTKVVNPGALKDRFYAFVDTETQKVMFRQF